MRQSFLRDGRLDTDKIGEELGRFLDLTFREAHLNLQYRIAASTPGPGETESAEILITFDGSDRDLLLERHAELLLALEYLAHRWLHLEPRLHDHVRFDCGDYRALRLEELKLSARVAAQRVRETREPFHFNPLSARERRVVHLELNSSPDVRTSSEGTGELRHVVIYPAENKK